MDAHAVFRQWIGNPTDPKAPVPPERRGRQGRLLQGTSAERYEYDVASWLHFIEETVPIGAWRAEPSHVRTWLDRQGGAERSRARRVSAVGAFYAYAVHFGHARHNPVDPALSGKAHLAPPGPRLNEGQVHLVRWGADQLQGAFAERDRLLVYLLLSGLRSRQIVELSLADLHFEQHRLTADVWQKGGGTRPVAFPAEVRSAVQSYLPWRRWRGPESSESHGPLLTSYRGNRLDSQPSPGNILKGAVNHARACTDPDAPELPVRVTPDMVALSESPFDPLEEAGG